MKYEKRSPGHLPRMEGLESRLLLAADVVISEIMYQSFTDLGQPEDVGEEFIELHNRGDAPADLLGWRIADGVDFEFPAATIPAGGYLVVAANPEVFHTKYPTVTNYIADHGWVGRLSNSGERIRIEDAAGSTVDQVEYADEGDWAVRERVTDEFGMEGLVWSDAHDGGGKSLELINPALTNNVGQNWAASIPIGGTPGAPNSVASADIAPLIRNPEHTPAIPRSTDPVTVRAEIVDELGTGLNVTLFYREDGDPTFISLPMFDDGLHDDDWPADGVYAAVIPSGSFTHGTVVEFYIQASDAAANSRTWPAPVAGVGQVANGLFQVDDTFNPAAEWVPGTPPEFRIITTAADWAYFQQWADISGRDYKPNGQMNATFIATDGVSRDVRYETGVRNRGNGSRSHDPHNLRINLPHDRPYKGYKAVNLNAQRPYSQTLGSAVFRYAGLAASDGVQVKVLTNGVDRADAGSDMYGYYIWLEPPDSDFVANHWPDDASGNLYKCNYYLPGGRTEARLEYLGENPDLYRNEYNKQTNVAQDDFTDLIGMLDVLNNAPDETFWQEVNQVINVEEWVRFMAVDTLLGNSEGGLITGDGDDYMLYAGIVDPRFQLVPYDLDSITIWGSGSTTRSIWSYRSTSLPGLYRLLNHPNVAHIYYNQLLDLIENVFTPDVIGPLVDQVLGGWRSAATRNDVKNWIASRVANVLTQIPRGELTAQADLPSVGGWPHTTSQSVTFSGTADSPTTGSVLVGGGLADWDPETGQWTFDAAGNYEQRTLLASNSPLSYRVPQAGDDPAAWTVPGFDDSGWADSRRQDAAGLVLTEIGTGATKFVEVENVADAPIDTTGWVVLLNDASGGINAVNSTAWSLPASVAPGEVLYRTDDPADNYWGAPMDLPETGDGWAMVLDDTGGVQDFVAWGYTAAEIATLSLSWGAFTGITAAGKWSGDGAPVGTTGGGPVTEGWVAYNDHIRGAGTHANATTYDDYASTGSPSSGPLKDIATGADLPVTLTVADAGNVYYASSADPPAPGTDAWTAFDGYVDFDSATGASIELRGAGATLTHTFSGLDTGDVITYDFTGTAIRGNSGYTNRWTLVTLLGADAATPAHSVGDGVITSGLGPNQVAIWVGDNSTASQGYVAAWTDIDPGPDGSFSVRSEQYTGPIPTSIDPGGVADGSKGYGLAGIRLEEVGPAGPRSWLKRGGSTDGDAAGDWSRATAGSMGAQNAELTVPFGTLLPNVQGIGFDGGDPAYASLIATDVGAEMQSVNASLFVRMEFTPPALPGYDAMTLRLRYDDGFVAYLNGTKIAERNAPATPAWNSAATASHDNAQAVVFEDIDVSTYLGLLSGGQTNVLAIHALNASAADADMLLQAELTASRGTPQDGLGMNPGINRIPVEAYSGPDGTGELIDSTYVDVWYDAGVTNTYPQGPPAAPPAQGQAEPPAVTASLHLTTRDSYLPGVPVLVRVEALDADGNINRDLWDATASLSVDNANVFMDVNTVTLYNGLGTALVTFTHGAGSQDFNLTASLGAFSDTDDLTDLTGQAAQTYAGTLSDASGTTTWSGIVHVTGDLTVPAGQTLDVQPGTLVLIDGVASGSGGTVITVDGTLQSLGTEDSPVTWTAYTAGQNWGEIAHTGTATYQYTSITQGGHSSARGHSNTGPTISSSGSATLLFDHANLTDEAGKVMHGGGASLTFRDTHLGRSVMGPELWADQLLLERTWITDMHNFDDADGIYIHNTAPGNALMTGGVVAVVDDDGIDTMDAVLTIDDYVIRDAFDKGVSVFDGDVTIQWSLVIDNATDSEDGTSSSVSAKSNSGDSATVRIDHSTIVGVRQAGITDVAIELRNKYNPSNPMIVYHVANSILSATDPIKSDYALNSGFVVIDVTYTNTFGEDWIDVGNINADPVFADAAAHNYRLLGSSPSIDAGDPAYPLDADGTTTDQGRYTNQTKDIVGPGPGDLPADTTWRPEDGQYRVADDLTVPAGVTLTIEPGTTVFFDAGARLIVEGTLRAEGTAAEPIRFTRAPGAGQWGGIDLVGTMTDNVIRGAILEYVHQTDGMITVDQSRLTLEDSWLDHAQRRRIATTDSSLVVRNNTFTDLFETIPPTVPNNVSEHIWGGGIAPGGVFLVEGNTFGRTPGHNDAIDFDGPFRPGPVAEIRDNVFLGGGDDALDLETDAHIEGNVFTHYVKDAYNADPGESNVISAGGGAPGAGHHFVVVRNAFYDCQHAILVKESSTLTFVGNTVADCATSAIYFDLPGQTSGPGVGAAVRDSIFDNTPVVYDLVGSSATITIDHSLVNPPDVPLGTGNLVGDARLVDPAGGDFHLAPGSDAAGAGSLGQDLGAMVPAGAVLSTELPFLTPHGDAAFTVGGNAIEAYRWRLDGGPWSAEAAPGSQVLLGGLGDGDHLLEVVALDSAGAWQDEADARSFAWTVDSTLSRVLLNEVLASNVSLAHEGTYPDFIELYNDSAAPVDIGGMSISDDPTDATKFVFSPGTVLPPGGYLVLYADDAAAPTSGIHLGFALGARGDDVWLFDGLGAPVDSIAFGTQVDDLSLGRIGPDRHWALNQPTPGAANVAQPTAAPDGVLVNEWFTNGDIVLIDDFIELYNPDSLPVNLEGLYLTDNPANQKTKFRFGPYNFIGAGGFRDIVADDSTSPGHAPFQLSAKMEILALYGPDLDVRDYVYYGPQTEDVSQGRAPDGGSDIQFFTLPTPGVGNVYAATGSTVSQTLVAETAAKQVLVPTGDIGTAWRSQIGYDTTGWHAFSGAPGGVGYDSGGGEYHPLIGLDVEGEMDNTNPTCYIRIPFTFSGDPAEVSALWLNVRYDDGFIAYLNGTEVARVNFGSTSTPAWNSSASTGHSDSEAVTQVGFDISAWIGLLNVGQNLLAIHGLNVGASSSDFLISAELVAEITQTSQTPFANLLALHNDLRITEMMYNPTGSDSREFIELKNTGLASLDLAGVRFTDGVDFVFPDVTLAPGEYIVLARDLAAFQDWYGAGINAVGDYDPDALSNAGEGILLQMPAPYEAAILRFDYDDNWYPSTDGDGASLVINDPDGPRRWWDRRARWHASSTEGGSPGTDDPTPQWPLGSVVINEVLAHSDDLARGDWIELHNTTDTDIDISGWFLSDDVAVPQKYVIAGDPSTPMAPGNTVLPAGGYIAFNQLDNFGVGAPDPGALIGFGFSELGDQAVVASCDATGALGTYRDTVAFGASARNVPFGRYVTSTGAVDFVALAEPDPDPEPGHPGTYGYANAEPLIGPIVFEEIMYHPATGGNEYLLLRNISGAPADLYDPANPQNTWKVAGGVDFTFPQTNVTVPADGRVLLVDTTPQDYLASHVVPDGVQVFGPFLGALSNGGEAVSLTMPGAPDPLPDPPGGFFVPTIDVETVKYGDSLPWAEEPDGTGPALRRIDLTAYGNDPANWTTTGTPPAVTVNPLTTNDTTPALGGTVTDEAAPLKVVVTVGGTDYVADIAGNTWSIPDDTIGPLTPGTYDVTVRAGDPAGNTGTDTTTDELTILGPPPQVVGRFVFYNNSFFDGYDPAASAADDAAIATDKTALLPGQTASFANYTSYTKGINGVILDVADLPETAAAGENFAFRTGNSNDPTGWAVLATPPAIAVRPGAGVGGADRITLTWPDGTVRNTWLQVRFLANAATHLPAEEVFYFGNAVGESGNDPANAWVTANDEALPRNNPTFFFNPAQVDNPLDYNRDHKVDGFDQAIARNNPTFFLNALRLITVPAAPPSAAGAGDSGDSGMEAGALAEVPLSVDEPVGELSALAAGPVPQPAGAAVVAEGEFTPAAGSSGGAGEDVATVDVLAGLSAESAGSAASLEGDLLDALAGSQPLGG